MALWIPASILLSAVTYLFDFVSNIVVVVESKRKYPDAFWTMVAVLIHSHTFNALLFKFKFNKDRNAVRAAYFLPLIHLWRLFHLLRTTLSFKGVGKLRSEELNSLFCMLSLAMESMPLLYLQITALVQAGHNMSIIFKVSIAAAFLSAFYNGGSSVQALTPSKHRAYVTVSAGLYTMFASMVRCITFINVMVKQERAKKTAYTLGIVVCYWLFYWLILFPKLFSRRIRNARKFLTCFVLSYISLLCGPLYPMVSEGRETGEIGASRFRYKMFAVATANLFIDYLSVGWSYYMRRRSGRGMPMYLWLVTLVGTPGYMISLLWYVKLLKQLTNEEHEKEVQQCRVEVQEDMNGNCTVQPELVDQQPGSVVVRMGAYEDADGDCTVQPELVDQQPGSVAVRLGAREDMDGDCNVQPELVDEQPQEGDELPGNREADNEPVTHEYTEHLVVDICEENFKENAC